MTLTIATIYRWNLDDPYANLVYKLTSDSQHTISSSYEGEQYEYRFIFSHLVTIPTIPQLTATEYLV